MNNLEARPTSTTKRKGPVNCVYKTYMLHCTVWFIYFGTTEPFPFGESGLVWLVRLGHTIDYYLWAYITR